MDTGVDTSPWEPIGSFTDRQKAIEYAQWLNFKHRLSHITFGVHQDQRGVLRVFNSIIRDELDVSFTETIPEDCCELSYADLERLGADTNPLEHWSEIRGMMSTLDGDVLRFILDMKVPLEKFIRSELANRGFDKDHRWCGFEKAKEIWLTE